MASPVVETSADRFEADVFERSHEQPVVVDFWAAWCAPCRMLTPVLEKLADEYAGQFVLVKADVDQNPAAAKRFQVQGIPAVYGVIGGKIESSFSGAMPEPQIRMWLDQLCGRHQLHAAQQLETTQPAEAEQRYRQLLEKTPNLAEAQVGLARTLYQQSQFEQCRELLAQLEERGFLEPEAEKLKASLDLKQRAGVDLAAVQQEAEARPEDPEAQLVYAQALAAEQRYEEALQQGLKVVQRSKSGPGEKARQLMVDIFRVLPEDSELTNEYRRKLSLALY